MSKKYRLNFSYPSYWKLDQMNYFLKSCEEVGFSAENTFTGNSLLNGRNLIYIIDDLDPYKSEEGFNKILQLTFLVDDEVSYHGFTVIGEEYE